MSKKFTCGSIVPSACVPYSGKDLAFLTTEEQPCCDANLDDVIDLIGDAIKDLEDNTDVSNHTLGCLSVTGDLTLKKLDQAQTDKICALDAQLSALTEQFNDLDIAQEHITIDLGCLNSVGSPCQIATNTYTLISILTLFKSEICAIKSHLGI